MRKSKFVCVGLLDSQPCGVAVTAVQFRRQDGMCEYCALEWYERVKAWRWGQTDALCSVMMSARSGH
jgi:hypothetical protein